MCKKGKLWALIFVFIVIILVLFCVYKPSRIENNETNQTKYPRVRGIDIKYCEGIGYEYELRAEHDRQVGYCVFPDGEECKSFEFITGECGRGYSLCESKGYLLNKKVEKLENGNAIYAICIFPDYTYCKEVDFFNKDCHVKW